MLGRLVFVALLIGIHASPKTLTQKKTTHEAIDNALNVLMDALDANREVDESGFPTFEVSSLQFFLDDKCTTPADPFGLGLASPDFQAASLVNKVAADRPVGKHDFGSCSKNMLGSADAKFKCDPDTPGGMLVQEYPLDSGCVGTGAAPKIDTDACGSLVPAGGDFPKGVFVKIVYNDNGTC